MEMSQADDNSNSPKQPSIDQANSSNHSSTLVGRADICLPWHKKRQDRLHQLTALSPFQFSVTINGQRKYLIYDSLLKESNSSISFLNNLNVRIEETSYAKIVRLPSLREKFECCMKNVLVPVTVGAARFSFLVWATTVTQPEGLFVGEDFATEFIRRVDEERKEIVVTDGQIYVRCRYHRLKRG